MEYRGFIIEPCFKYSDGRMDGMYYKNLEEKTYAICRQTLAEVKEDIDELYFCDQNYSVGKEVFTWLTDAVAHARKSGGIVEPKIEFDSF